MKENIICSNCGAVLDEENVRTFGSVILCETCFEENTAVCDDCGTRIWADSSDGDDYHILCSSCYERNYTNCECCGRLIHNDDAYYFDEYDDYPYCLSCYEKREEAPIKTYNYKPKPIFYGNGELFMGVELEIDKGGEYDENATALQDIANAKETRIYCKHDGSINDGFEIVSHPMTLEYHTNNMNWQEIFEKAVNMDYRSHNTETCGLHIHVNRNAFDEQENAQEAVIGRIVFFVEKHWNELVKLSRRASYNLNRWASRYATISSTTKETYDKAKGKCLGRYVAVNMENANTIEFRMFRGTLRYSTFIATLQLVYEICRIAMMLSDRELEELKKGRFEEIKISQGDILKICASGRLEKDKFTYNEYIGKGWWEYGNASCKNSFLMDDDADYIADLKTVANYYGHSPDAIDDLLSQGFSPFEIEEFLYEF